MFLYTALLLFVNNFCSSDRGCEASAIGSMQIEMQLVDLRLDCAVYECHYNGYIPQEEYGAADVNKNPYHPII